MAQSSYQEPIDEKDLNLAKKIREVNIDAEKGVLEDVGKKEVIPISESAGEKTVETKTESPEEKISEKIETARKTIGAQSAKPTLNVASDAQAVANIQEFEKKVEKLIELAIQKGPEHAIRVAQHMDKGKESAQADNYTLDEIHDRLMEDELRAQLIQKGMLKEL